MRFVLVCLACLALIAAGCQPMPAPAPAAEEEAAAEATAEPTEEATEEAAEEAAAEATAEPTEEMAEEPAAEAMSDEEKIANALSAGPASIAEGAAVMDFPAEAGGELVELRPGTNGWTCTPDDPTTPTNDPQCLDAVWLEWLKAVLAGNEPEVTTLGFAYMLQGGSVADNDDPTVMEPPAGQEWQVDPPHVMILSPDPLDMTMLTNDHHSGGHWVMFGGTPMEHIMMPVELPPLESEAGDDKIANALSAGPASIAEGAAVMDFPAEAGGELVELRPGTNGWTCTPDDPTTPTNDPQCLDAVWLEWLKAVLAGNEPEVTTLGFAYMLQGGSVADNDDPTVMEPPAGQEWQVDPPHVMILSPDPLDMTMLTNDHHSGGHWVMFGGTPMEHIMMPVTGPEEATGEEAATHEAMSDEEKIATVTGAGPSTITDDAAVLDWPAAPGEAPVELRAGTNGWVCRPDDPITPALDSRCFHPTYLKLNGVAFGADREAANSFGVAYMLNGGNAADNDDPSVITPVAGTEWQTDPPHLMITSPTQWDMAVVTNDHHSGGPWIMFNGSPAEHMMIPIGELPQAVPADDKIANAMSAGPASIAEAAAIMDWPAEAGGDFVELRAGDNGWTCLPDDPSTPTGNDPWCIDEEWMSWLEAFMAGAEPQVDNLGIAYMLQGGPVADNDDPMVMEPAAGHEWQVDPPHIMILSPLGWDAELFPPDMAEGPFIMFDDTPYEHLMFPVVNRSEGN